MTDIMSIQSSLLTDEMRQLKHKRERKALFLAIFSQFIWAVSSIQLKSYGTLFPKHYSDNSLVFWRSVPIWVFGYYFAKKKGIEIPVLSQVQSKVWFFFRTLGNYFSLLFWVMMLNYFRVSTCQCISGCQPVLILLLSIFILKEKFYFRYLVGIILCIFGTAVIVLNEKSPKEGDDASNENKRNILVGIFLALLNLFVSAFSTFGQKVMLQEKMSNEAQSYYIGMYNSLAGAAMSVVEFHFGITNILYVLYGLSNGFVFYIANYYSTLALIDMPMSKFIPLTYLILVFVYLLGFTILREPVYFTDILGSLLILSFQLYNVWVPLKK